MTHMLHIHRWICHFKYMFRVLLLMVVVNCATSGMLGAQQPLVTISWSFAVERISLGEPVVLRLLVSNNSSSVATLDLGSDFTRGLQVTIITPDGSVVPTPVKQLSDGVHALGTVQINPGS